MELPYEARVSFLFPGPSHIRKRKKKDWTPLFLVQALVSTFQSNERYWRITKLVEGWARYSLECGQTELPRKISALSLNWFTPKSWAYRRGRTDRDEGRQRTECLLGFEWMFYFLSFAHHQVPFLRKQLFLHSKIFIRFLSYAINSYVFSLKILRSKHSLKVLELNMGTTTLPWLGLGYCVCSCGISCKNICEDHNKRFSSTSEYLTTFILCI